MSRFWILCGLILGIFIVLVSCKNDQPTAPQQFHDVTVNIDGLDTIYTAPEGDLIATAFEIVVTGMDGVPVEEVPVSIWVESGPGDVASREWTTSADGTVQALYYVTVPLGDTTAIICAVVGLDTTTESVKLRGEIAPVAIELQPDPPVIETQYGQSAQTQLTATVTNPTGLPAPDVNVMFSVTGGEAQIEGSGVTDEDGHVRATLNVDGSWFGEVEITAAVVKESESPTQIGYESWSIQPLFGLKQFAHLTGTEPLIATATVEVRLQSEIGLNFLTPDTTFAIITGQDRYSVTAQLADESGEPITSVPVTFDCDPEIATIEGAALTNADGIAAANLTLLGNPGTMTIHAAFAPLNLSDAISIEVIDNISLNASLRLIDAGPAVWVDSAYSVEVVVRFPDCTPGIGVPVRLVSELTADLSQSQPTNREGVSIFSYTPRQGGEETLQVVAQGLTLNHEPLTFPVLAFPGHIEEDIIPVESDHPSLRYLFNFQLVDSSGFGIPAETVYFETSLGYFNTSMVVTDTDGSGCVELHRGLEAGLTQIIVTWRDVVQAYALQFYSGPPYHLYLNLRDLEPGWQPECRTLDVSIRDRYNNLPNRETTVIFEVVRGSGVFFDSFSQIDSVVTLSNAEIYFRPGPELEDNRVRAFSWRDSARTDTISRTVSIPYLPYEPFYIELSVNDDGVDAGGGAWAIEVSARVTDYNHRPVLNGHPVVFTVEPEIANITPGHTGNESRSGDRFPGVAFAQLVYNSVNTGDTIEIEADIQRVRNRGRIDYVLPLQDGRIEVDHDPANFQFNFQDEEVEQWIRLWTVVQDGHDIETPAVMVEYGSNLGRFDPDRLVRSDEAVMFGGQMADFFDDPFTEEVDCWIVVTACDYPEVTTDTLRFVVSREVGFVSRLDLNVDPANWMFNHDNDSVLVHVWATASDPQGNPVNDIPILFTSNISRFWWYNHETEQYIPLFSDSARMVTGIVDNENDEAPGQATVFLLLDNEIWDDDPFRLELTIHVNAQVEGHDDLQADPAFIFVCRRGGR